MTPKNKLFIGILAFMLLINILVGFNLNQFYIRAILAFIFLITIPGLLIMLCLRIRNINFWEYLVYTVGLSVAFIMFAGLAANWTLPALGITDKPLSLEPILICFNIFLFILWIIAYKRNKDLSLSSVFPFSEYKHAKGKSGFTPKFPKFSWLDRIFLIIPFCFPFMAVLGAFLLNNHGTNLVTMIMLGSIAVYVFLVVLFRDKLNENVYPWALWMIGLSLLLMYSMRNWYVTGYDINQEYQMFKLSGESVYWSISNFKDAYNSCLSITILPIGISLFTKLSGSFVFKLLLQLIFSLFPLTVFLISRKFLRIIPSFLACFFIISNIIFIETMPAVTRQEIALLFFSIMLLVLFIKEFNSKTRSLLFIIFGFSMIVSHYSTAYIALAMFLFACIFIFFYKKWEDRKIKKGKLKPSEKQEVYLGGILVLILLVFGFLWYSQVTDISGGLVGFVETSAKNMGQIFQGEMRGENVKSALSLDKSADNFRLVQEYAKNMTSNKNETASDYLVPTYAKINPYQKNYTSVAYYINLSINLIFKLLLLFGGVYILLFWKKLRLGVIFPVLNLFCIILLTLILFLPYVSVAYDFDRVYFQSVIVLSISMVMGAIFLIDILIKSEKAYIILSILIIFFFLLSSGSGILNQLVGGFDSPLHFNNFGEQYDRFYTHKEDILSTFWYTRTANGTIYLDRYSFTKEVSYGNIPKSNIKKEMIPSNSNNKVYIYSGYTNKIYQRVFAYFRYRVISFNFPTQFLNDNKNKIYNNGGSEIFK